MSLSVISRKRATGLHERNTRFLLDTNVLHSCCKKRLDKDH